ncbi:MAG: hypothetical protein QM680_13620 [Luteolibacter sp.]
MEITLSANTPQIVTGLTSNGTYRFFFNSALDGLLSIQAENTTDSWSELSAASSGVINGLPGTKLRLTSPYDATGQLDLLE